MHYFTMKILNKRELQQILTLYHQIFTFQKFVNLHEKHIAKSYFFSY